MDIDTDTHRPKSKREKQILDIPKLVDANEAGGKFSDKCTLILTGGSDSLKDLAIKGICSVVGQDCYGVFPLGKLLNVREASHKQIIENAEIQHIKHILGLQDGKVYDSVNSLRYGQLIIMTNQDREGSLIKGLFINFIRFFWPSLLKIPSFLVEVCTPIVKGVGSCTKEEAKEWFQNLKTHLRYFTWVDETDGDAIDMTFSEKIEERKTWILKFENWFNHEKKLIRYRDFVTKELMLYSLADMQRYIPSMVDGLNEVQRTILCCAFNHDLVNPISVPGFLSLLNHSTYHYASLIRAIIGMANDFVGSNNVNLFGQEGQFGSRLQGGKDHEASWYLYTNLTPIARLLFPKDDDILYMNEDGQPIQPTWYAPVIPLVLVNGCQEFGIGWSTSVPNYNPKQLCENVRRLLNGDPSNPIDPWYKGFQGTIERNGASYTTIGKIDCIDDTTLWITELPVHTWTKYYKEFLDTLCTCTGEIEEPFIKNYREHNDEIIVHFEINMSNENMELAKKEGLVNKFNLTTTISTDNMLMRDPQGVIKKYDNPEQILEEFFHFRLQLYEKRKIMMLKYLELEQFKLEFKEYILYRVKNGNFTGKTKENVLIDLKQRDLLTLFQKTSQATRDLEVNEERFSRFYKDLFFVDLSTASESMFKLQKEILSNQLNELKNTAPEDLWRNDLDVLEHKLDELERELEKEAEDYRDFLERKLMNEAKMINETKHLLV